MSNKYTSEIPDSIHCERMYVITTFFRNTCAANGEFTIYVYNARWVGGPKFAKVGNFVV